MAKHRARRRKIKFATVDFYNTLSAGPQVFLYRCLECLSFNAGQLSKISYAGFVLEPMSELETFAQKNGAGETNLLSASFPMDGFGFIRMSQDKQHSVEGCRDRCFVFDKVTKHPVYVGVMSFVSHEERGPSLIRTNMIAAFDEKEATSFVEEYVKTTDKWAKGPIGFGTPEPSPKSR